MSRRRLGRGHRSHRRRAPRCGGPRASAKPHAAAFAAPLAGGVPAAFRTPEL